MEYTNFAQRRLPAYWSEMRLNDPTSQQAYANLLEMLSSQGRLPTAERDSIYNLSAANRTSGIQDPARQAALLAALSQGRSDIRAQDDYSAAARKRSDLDIYRNMILNPALRQKEFRDRFSLREKELRDAKKAAKRRQYGAILSAIGGIAGAAFGGPAGAAIGSAVGGAVGGA